MFLSNSCKAFLAYSSIHVESLLIHWLHMFDCNLACVHFVSSSTGGYAIALVELIKLAFSVLNRLLARKEKVCLFRIILNNYYATKMSTNFADYFLTAVQEAVGQGDIILIAVITGLHVFGQELAES